MPPPTVTVLIAAEPGKSLAVPFQPQEPVHFLLTRIALMLKENSCGEQDHVLFVNGIPITDLQKSLSDYSIFGSCLTYQNLKEGEWMIHARTFSGEVTDINCNPDDTIRQVKKKIYAKGGTHLDELTLFIGVRGRQLENNKTLRDYKFRSGSTLTAAPFMGGGGELSFPGILHSGEWDTPGLCNFRLSSHVSRGRKSSDAPRGRKAYDGANVECECKCNLRYGIICPQGYGLLEISQTTFYCSLCKTQDEKVIPVAVGFVNCKYRIHAIKDATGEQYTSSWKIVKPEAGYELYHDGTQAIWRRVVIESGLSCSLGVDVPGVSLQQTLS
ncbi:hypothetical protein BGZ54_000198 [Gamsiella multidivaricata]|nr:hypothetical protein BGZ54_000198 [Gamsiella multidivaricata]